MTTAVTIIAETTTVAVTVSALANQTMDWFYYVDQSSLSHHFSQ